MVIKLGPTYSFFYHMRILGGLLLEAVREWRKVVEMGVEGETAERAKMSLDRVERELKQ